MALVKAGFAPATLQIDLLRGCQHPPLSLKLGASVIAVRSPALIGFIRPFPAQQWRWMLDFWP
jgi:hypothetical protein